MSVGNVVVCMLILVNLVTFTMCYWSLLIVPLALIGPCDVRDDLLVTLGLHRVASIVLLQRPGRISSQYVSRMILRDAQHCVLVLRSGEVFLTLGDLSWLVD